MIAGRGGELKSTLVLADVAAGTRGELRGRNHGAPVRSLIVATEDSPCPVKGPTAGCRRRRRALRVLRHPRHRVQGFDVTPISPVDLTELERVAVEFGADLDRDRSAVVGGARNLDKGDIIRSAMDPLFVDSPGVYISPW